MAEDSAPPPAHTWNAALLHDLTRERFEPFEFPTEVIPISSAKVVFVFGQNRAGITRDQAGELVHVFELIDWWAGWEIHTTGHPLPTTVGEGRLASAREYGRAQWNLGRSESALSHAASASRVLDGTPHTQSLGASLSLGRAPTGLIGPL